MIKLMIKAVTIVFILITFWGCKKNYTYNSITTGEVNGIKIGMNKKQVLEEINSYDNLKYKRNPSIKSVLLRPFPFGYLGRSSLESMPPEVTQGFKYLTEDLELNYYSATLDDRSNYVYDDVFKQSFLWEWSVGEWPVDHLALYFNSQNKLYRIDEFLIYFELP